MRKRRLVVFAVIDDDQSLVDSVNVTSPKYPTYRGIKVGDSLSSVKAAYGEGEQNGNFYLYEEPFLRMIQFEMDKGKVKSITIAKLEEMTGE